MSHNEVQVRAIMVDRLREAREARLATEILRARRRARRRDRRFPRAARRRLW